MKKIFLATAITAFVVFASCGSSPKATGTDELDIAIREASNYLNGNVPNGNKIVILNVQSDSAALSDYVIDELIANAVNDKIFSVVDRAQLDLIREEQKIQYSGEVDDNAALAIGKFLGAQTIVSGAVSALGNGYRMRIRALDVLTAQVQGQFNRNIAAGSTINMLMASRSGSGGTATATATGGRSGSSGSGTTQTATPAQPAAPAYKIGDTGPAGGLIFYDKGNRIGGWQYLEAAPANTERTMIWTATDMDTLNPTITEEESRKVGKGTDNTIAIMEVLRNSGGGFNTAVWYCDQLDVNGFDDWFLPSWDELNYMYGNLYMRELDNFKPQIYWSSNGSSYPSGGVGTVYTINFNKGRSTDRYDDLKRGSERYIVRAARRF